MTINKIKKIKESDTPYHDLTLVLDQLHTEGPISSDVLETLSYYKEFHPEIFVEVEEKIISALGLFYKIQEPNNIYSLLISGFGKQHKKDYGEYLTPVQASVRRAVDENQFISISAPTSAGKSYSIRDFIAEQSGDAVVVVPSRALIAEYMSAMKRKFGGNKNVMISAFVDNIFTSRNLKRIFILTPERARDLFLTTLKLNVKVFFFDEAQVSEEKARGVIFDVLVRRVQKNFPLAKLIFAHPFVDNPEAQFKKHGISNEDSFSRSYTHGTVGKISIQRHSNGNSYYFTPFEEKGYTLKKCIEFPEDFERFALNGKHSILVYVSKASIYKGVFLENFQKDIDLFPLITDPKAKEIIETIEHLLGADQSGHRSKMVSLLHKGVVIHHGSVPLEVRFLVEDFIRNRYAKICFATSTLAQGVNMPFDIVWLESMRFMGDDGSDRSLAFKNLIGRAGRLSDEKKFDYGYIFTESAKLFTERINDHYHLSEESLIDSTSGDDHSDTEELIDSIRSGTFNDELHLPQSKAERLSSEDTQAACKRILDIIYKPGTIRENLSGSANRTIRLEICEDFKILFESSLNRQLFDGEKAVFDAAISIFLQTIQGRSFREIVGIRYSKISKREEGKIGDAAFSQPANKLPDSTLTRKYPLFKGVKAKDVSYDAVVFDTYDYVDQVISFSLSDVFSAAFKIYKNYTRDSRAEKMIELLRFGTNNAYHMLLMRYGFPSEDVAEITPYIQSINEENIVFGKEIENAPQYIRDLADWYRP